MQQQELAQTLNLYTEFSYLNTPLNKKFLHQKAHHTPYKDKDIIAHTKHDGLSIVYSGAVRVLRSSYKNDVISCYDLGIGCIFGIENIIGEGDNGYSQIISAIGETVICRIHKNDMLEQLQDLNVCKGLFNDYMKTMNYIMNP